MFWNNAGAMPQGFATTLEGRQSAKPNELVLNRHQNQAGYWNGGYSVIRGNRLAKPAVSWASPVFDLRPDLPYLNQTGQRQGVPVFRSKTGDWGSLWVVVEGLNINYGGITASSGLKVQYQEAMNPVDPSRVALCAVPQDISTLFAPNTEVLPAGGQLDGFTFQRAACLQFKPNSGSVDPIRFWQVNIYFDWDRTFTETVQLQLSASLY